MSKKYRYSEIFGKTFQGEGHFTGVPTVWIRFWGCNFSCQGFGQTNPRDPSTWILDYENVKVEDYKSMEELPVFHRGCDSSYSWAKKFGHLAHQKTAEEICEEIESVLPGDQPYVGQTSERALDIIQGLATRNKFEHPKSKQWHHLALTGGEPMMSQSAIVDILKTFDSRGSLPRHITVETNGTQAPRAPMLDLLKPSYNPNGFTTVKPGFEGWDNGQKNIEWFWSVSPKLSASGEDRDAAIQPDVLKEYQRINDFGQLKFVVDGSPDVWEEVEAATAEYRAEGIHWPVWIMPVGADREMQESHQAVIAEQAIERGYSVALRVHTWCFGNIIGK